MSAAGQPYEPPVAPPVSTLPLPGRPDDGGLVEELRMAFGLLGKQDDDGATLRERAQ